MGDSLQPTHHGDPEREFKFWVYPQKHELVNPIWDFRYNICNNSEFLHTNEHGIHELKCLGHSFALREERR